MTSTPVADAAGSRPPFAGSGPGGALIEQAIEAFQARTDRESNFRLLFDAYHGPLLRFFARKGLAPEDCHDLTQEAFLGIYRGLDGYRRDARFETWIYRIATTTYLRRLRAQHTAMRSGEEVSSESEAVRREIRTPADQLGAVIDKEQRRRLDEAIGQLPEQMRRALVLRIHRQLTYQEIATVMRISIQTVKAHLFQARKRLQERLGAPSVEGLSV